MLFPRLRLILVLAIVLPFVSRAQIPTRVQSPEEIRARRLLRGPSHGSGITQQTYVDALESGHPDLHWAGIAGLIAWDENDRRRFDARALRELAQSDDPKTCEYGIWLLGKYAALPDEEAVALLIRHIGSDDDRTRWRAIEALTEFGPHAAPARDALLVAAENGSSSMTVAHALEALGAVGASDPVALEVIMRWNRDGPQAVRDVARSALRALSAPAAPGLADELAAGGETAARAAAALSGMDADAKPVAAELAASLERLEGSAAYYAAEALGRIGPDALPEIRRLVTAGKTARRNLPPALRTLDREHPDGEALQLLFTLTQDSDPEVRTAAVKSLNLNKRSQARPRVLALSRADPDPRVRAAALDAMGEISSPPQRLVDHWAKALRDPHPEVRYRALGALARADDELTDKHWRAVVRLLEDSSPSIRSVAASRVRRYGALAAAAVPHVLELLEKADMHGRSWGAGELLKFIIEHAPNDEKKRLVLEKWLRSPNDADIAQDGLVAYGGAAVPAFRSAILSEEARAVSAGLSGVAELGPAALDALPEITKTARRTDRGRADDSVRALIAVDGASPETRAVLLELAEHPLETTRVAAMQVITVLDDPDDVTTLVARVLREDDSWRVRRQALGLLVSRRAMSPEVESLLVELLQISEEPNLPFVDQALRALTELTVPSESTLNVLLRFASRHPGIPEFIRYGWKRPDLVPVPLLARSQIRIPQGQTETVVCCFSRIPDGFNIPVYDPHGELSPRNLCNLFTSGHVIYDPQM